MTNKKPGREKPPGLIIILGKSAFADLIERTAVSKMLFLRFCLAAELFINGE